MKKILLFTISTFIICFLITPHKKEITNYKSNFNIYLEENGDYIKSNSPSFPNTGYYLNTTKSECENESVLSQNNDLSINLSFDKSDKCNLYFDKLKVVTFDANGGEVSMQSMLVRPGSTYENLPTPTRDGYTFLGWNGKNKFNKSDYLLLSNYNIETENSYKGAIIPLKPSKEYMVSAKRYNDYTGITSGYYLIDDTRSINTNWFGIAHPSRPSNKKKYTTNTDGYLYIGYLYATQQEMDIVWTNTDIQIEEGEEVTEFEPFYVTNGTKITQEKDHTLTAIWKENE